MHAAIFVKERTDFGRGLHTNWMPGGSPIPMVREHASAGLSGNGALERSTRDTRKKGRRAGADARCAQWTPRGGCDGLVVGFSVTQTNASLKHTCAEPVREKCGEGDPHFTVLVKLRAHDRVAWCLRGSVDNFCKLRKWLRVWLRPVFDAVTPERGSSRQR